MAKTLDIDADYLFFDNLVSATYVDLSGNTFLFNYVKVYPNVDEPDEEQDIALQTADTKFCVWNLEADFPFQNNALLTVGASNYRIIGFNKRSWETRWVLTAVMDAGEHVL